MVDDAETAASRHDHARIFGRLTSLQRLRLRSRLTRRSASSRSVASALRSLLQPRTGCGELRHEIQHGVRFWGLEREGALLGVMGLQDVEDVTLIRHAYVRTSDRRRGIGTQLLKYLQSRTSRPLLVGTWAAAGWAVRFYCQHGFALVSRDQIPLLLRRYWSVPERQIATSVVLADRQWLEAMGDHR